MINVKISLSTPFNISLKGHAGADVYGKDIICASASMLVLTLAEFVLEMKEKNEAENVQVMTEPGDAYIQFDAKGENLIKAQTIMNFIETGFRMLSDSYPEYVNTTVLEA